MTEFLSSKDIKIYKKFLEEGAVCAFPTDTVWGVGCLPSSEVACKKIYKIKKRDGNKPLILLADSIDSAKPYVSGFCSLAKQLAFQYWPGALTLVLEKSSKVPSYVNSGFETIGVRIPNHPVLLEFLQKVGPIVSTSANLSNEPAATTKGSLKTEIIEQLGFVLDDKGISCKGIESTVIMVSQDNHKVLRKGAIDLESK